MYVGYLALSVIMDDKVAEKTGSVVDNVSEKKGVATGLSVFLKWSVLSSRPAPLSVFVLD